MGFFRKAVENGFITSPTGERLFYRGWPGSRPFIIPDPETEQRLRKKSLWMARITFGGLIFGQSILVGMYAREIFRLLDQPLWCLAYLVVVSICSSLAYGIVLARELKKLQRLLKPLPRGWFYRQRAEQLNESELMPGFIASVLFVIAGVWMLDKNWAIGIFLIAFFGGCAIAIGYMSSVKQKPAQSPSDSDDRQES